MEHEVTNSAARAAEKIAANTYFENVSASETNKFWIQNLGSDVKMLFFKLKHPPVTFSIQGTAFSKTMVINQISMIALDHYHNIVYTHWSGNWDVNDGNFSFQYVRDLNDTNIIQNVTISGQDVLFDGVHQIFSQAAEKP